MVCGHLDASMKTIFAAEFTFKCEPNGILYKSPRKLGTIPRSAELDCVIHVCMYHTL